MNVSLRSLLKLLSSHATHPTTTPCRKNAIASLVLIYQTEPLLVQLDTIFNESTTSEAVCIGRVSDIAISTHDVSTWTHDVLNFIDLQTEGTLQFKKGFLCIFLSSLGSSDGCLFGLRQLSDVLILLCYLSLQLLDCNDVKSNLILILARAVNTDSPLYSTNVLRDGDTSSSNL